MIGRRQFLAGSAALGCAAVAAPASAQLVPLPTANPIPVPGGGLPIVSQPTSAAVVGPLSGPYAQLGEQLVNGVRGAFEDANNTGVLLSRFWSLRSFDDQNTLANALLASRFAIDDGSQSIVIGHLSGKITSQVIRTYSDNNIGLIVPAATTDSITSQGYRNVFRLPTKDSTEGLLHAKFVKREKRGSKIAVVYQDVDYGPDVAQTFLKQTQGDGLGSFAVKLATERTDFAAAASSIASQQADLVFFAGLAPALGPLIPSLRAAGWNGALDGSAGFFDGGLWPSYGKNVEGLIVSSSMPPLQIVPSATVLRTQYEQRYGAMSPIAAFAYAAAQIFIAAVQRFNSSQRIMVARAIAQAIPIDTLVGSFQFDPFGDPINPNVYYYQLENGQWRYLRADHPSSYIVH